MATGHTKLINEIIKEYGGDLRWRIWPNNTGSAFRAGRYITFGKIGSGDIIGFMNNGKFVTLEIKVGRDEQSDHQRDFQTVVGKYSAYYVVARSLDDVAKFLSRFTETL